MVPIPQENLIAQSSKPIAPTGLTATNVTPEQILYVQENQALFPGVQATSISVRTYSDMGKASANIVGYVGQITGTELAKLKNHGYQAGDQIGLSGIEAEYESYLRGTPGVEKVQVTALASREPSALFTPAGIVAWYVVANGRRPVVSNSTVLVPSQRN